MGLSASQARLLSITARLTHNETESQLITNSKLRLSDKSAEASEDYIEALNSTQYVYSYYDSTGSKAYYDLTVGTVTQFSEIKNQYGFVDAQGRLLVSETDAANFEDSDTLADFLSCYGVGTVTEADTAVLTSLYGSGYEDYYDSDDIYEWYNMINGTISGYTAEDLSDEDTYNTLSDAISALYSDSTNYQLLGASGGLFNNVVSALSSMPSYVAVAAYNYASSNTTCYTEVLSSVEDSDYATAAAHIEHNLSALIWGENGLASYASSLSNVTDNGNDTYTITSSSGITVTSTLASEGQDCSIGNTSYIHAYSDESDAFVEILMENLDSSEIAALIQDLIDLYCNAAAYLSTNFTDYTSANVTGTTSLTEEEIYNDWIQWYTDLGSASIEDWLNEVNEALAEFKAELDNVLTESIDTTDTKYQWYVNLWYRMGGKTASSKVSNPQNYYKVLGDEYMYNSDWLKFALEHGIVTMEQVQYQEEGETTAEEMNQYAWTSITYTSCSDLTEESDETAIAKAEVEYEQISAEIQAKDKKYDNDLKDLDTEHDALQTEYESIKSVIEKNVERSFKAFS